jgi:hypothetical protein
MGLLIEVLSFPRIEVLLGFPQALKIRNKAVPLHATEALGGEEL